MPSTKKSGYGYPNTSGGEEKSNLSSVTQCEGRGTNPSKTYPYKTSVVYNQHEVPSISADEFARGWAFGSKKGAISNPGSEMFLWGYALGVTGCDFKQAWFQFIEHWNEQADIRDRREANRRDAEATPADLPEDMWT